MMTRMIRRRRRAVASGAARREIIQQVVDFILQALRGLFCYLRRQHGILVLRWFGRHLLSHITHGPYERI